MCSVLLPLRRLCMPLPSPSQLHMEVESQGVCSGSLGLNGERIVRVRVTVKGSRVSIIQVYAPFKDAVKEVKEEI